ncbi:glycosyltransferase family protein [Pedobacter helvus]|uniref:Glycosyltransferase n=1 Tax=Pedobacter helvus TaxID=2563444 RepID=A0ABW9JL22_9SPHI|nr:glycosyltransferase [Pedobacter ureilyticus]
MNKSILIVGNFGIGALEHQFTNRLRNLNWNVDEFDIQTPVQRLKNKNNLQKLKFLINPSPFYTDVNNKLIRFCEKKKNNVILIFKGMEIFPETLKALKTNKNLICNYNPDHPFDFYSRGAGNQNVKNGIPHYDIYGSYSKSIADKLSLQYGVDTFVLPFGYDDNICPNSSSATNLFNFIGAYDRQRLNYLNQLHDMPLQVSGSSLWGKKIKLSKEDIIKVNSNPLYNQDYANLCKHSLGVINFLRPQNIVEQSHNMRTFEVPGYGGLLISERTEEQLSFFEEGKEAIYFSSIEELRDKMSYYKERLSEIENYKKNGAERSQKSGYSYTHRCLELSNLMKRYV